MKKNVFLLFLLFLLFLSNIIFSQEIGFTKKGDFPDGIYMTLEDVLNKKPSSIEELYFKTDTNTDSLKMPEKTFFYFKDRNKKVLYPLGISFGGEMYFQTYRKWTNRKDRGYEPGQYSRFCKATSYGRFVYFEEDLIVYGYPNEFKQSILSIINNCRDSILKRRQNEDIEGLIKINISSKEDETCIKIQDNGIGIKEEYLEKIFEPFFTSKKNGDGFGLYMVKLIIEDKMNGKIRALKCEDGADILICLKNKMDN
mgnify:CR=1 FL=1